MVSGFEKGARGMHIGKRAKTGKGARAAAIAQKVPVSGVLGAGTQYAYHGHLFKTGSRGGNRSHTGTFSPIAVARAPFFSNRNDTGTFCLYAYHGHLSFQYAYHGHLFSNVHRKLRREGEGA